MYMELAVGKIILSINIYTSSLGQYTRKGPVEALAKICPLLKGYFEIFN